MVHRDSLQSDSVLLCCTGNSAVKNAIWRKLIDQNGLNLRDGWNVCSMSASVTAWYSAEYVITKIS